MKKLIFVCGPAGIGKSTFCQQYIEKHPSENVKIVSSDEERKRITGSYLLFPPNKDMRPVYSGMVKTAVSIFEANPDVTILLDSTMLNDERRAFFLKNLPLFDEYDLYLLKLHDWNACLVRNKMRQQEKWVPDYVIENMIKKYKDPQPELASKFKIVKTIYLDDDVTCN
jgi:tRNA uridine 5-carbamoylmethylation protein Kti12